MCIHVVIYIIHKKCKNTYYITCIGIYNNCYLKSSSNNIYNFNPMLKWDHIFK
jgi:hypothetical protein